MQSKSKGYEKSPRKVYIRTYGCQMNVSDAEAVAGMLRAQGYAITDDEGAADIIFLVTCSVRDMAEQKVVGKLGIIAKRKSQNPDLVIGVLGCMAERMKEELVRKMPFVDIVCGPKDILKLPEMVKKVVAQRKSILAVDGEEILLDAHVPRMRAEGVSAWVTVMRGCNNYCSYCVVPYVRGREISRDPNDIVEEVKQLVVDGYKEIFLLGQNVNSYNGRAQSAERKADRGRLADSVERIGDRKKEKNDICDFAELLEMVNDINGVERIRFVTSHPKDISGRLVDAMANLEKVCEYLHFPAQSGSDNVLQRMNRGYTSRHYIEITEKLRNKVDGIALSSDFIVGFPGETDADFRKTLDLVRLVEFDSAFVFKYSVRTGTKAALLKDDVPKKVKEERHAELLQLVEELSHKRNRMQEGQTKEILVEGVSKRNFERLSGRTRDNRTVVFDAEGQKNERNVGKGELVNIKIERATTKTLYGKIC